MPPKAAPAKTTAAKTTSRTTKTTTASKPAAKSGAVKGTAGASKGATGAAKGGAGVVAKKDASAPAAEKQQVVKAPIIPKEVVFKSIAKVLLDDSGEWQDSGKWPLVIDPEEKSVTFLRYRDCNIIDVLDFRQIEAETLRKALLGALRYHKPLVIVLDLSNDTSMLELLKDRFGEIYPELLEDILTKKVMEEENCRKIVRDSDDDDYKGIWSAEGFKFILVTKSMEPSEIVKEKTFPLVVTY